MTELKTFSELSQLIESELRAVSVREKLESIERKRERQDQAVVGGVYSPDPVDRAAAMLLARAPWWAFAPSIKRDVKKENRIMSDRQTIPAVPIVAGYSKDQIDKAIAELADAVLTEIKQRVPEDMRDLAECTVRARDMLWSSAKDVATGMAELERVTKDASHQVRMQRMSIVSECSSVVNAMKDVRQFFLGPDYEREQKRLSEFVDLCERLKKLKDSGFLDTVADTMIRLATCEKIAIGGF